MPNPSELERQAQEADQALPHNPGWSPPFHALSARYYWRLRSWLWHQRMGNWKERIAIWIAWRLPRSVVLWAMIRVAAHATTGRWGGEHPGNLTYKDMHDRWGQDND